MSTFKSKSAPSSLWRIVLEESLIVSQAPWLLPLPCCCCYWRSRALRERESWMNRVIKRATSVFLSSFSGRFFHISPYCMALMNTLNRAQSLLMHWLFTNKARNSSSMRALLHFSVFIKERNQFAGRPPSRIYGSGVECAWKLLGEHKISENHWTYPWLHWLLCLLLVLECVCECVQYVCVPPWWWQGWPFLNNCEALEALSLQDRNETAMGRCISPLEGSPTLLSKITKPFSVRVSSFYSCLLETWIHKIDKIFSEKIWLRLFLCCCHLYVNFPPLDDSFLRGLHKHSFAYCHGKG